MQRLSFPIDTNMSTTFKVTFRHIVAANQTLSNDP